MADDLTRTTLGKTGIQGFRLGLSGTYRPGKDAIFRAIDAGINYFFSYGFDGQMIRALQVLGSRQSPAGARSAMFR
jgi:hypothetical protein